MTVSLILISFLIADCRMCDNKGELTCPDCAGEFRTTQQVPCRKEGTIGCNGQGERECFHCKGGGTIRCEPCKGTGTIRRRVLVAGVNRYEYRDQMCGPCQRRGRVSCPQCSKGMIRCPRCLGTGTFEDTVLCGSCRAGKIPCPECGKPRPAARELPPAPLRLTHAMRLKEACRDLDDELRESIATIVDEYYRLRTALDRFARDEDWERLAAAVRESDKRVEAVARDE